MIFPCPPVVASDWCWGNVDGVELDGDGNGDGACDGVAFDDEF
jgi:hypothetical protein